ncbi:motility protein A [Clostridium hydrogeniformans]|uniref:motility protein A n=1 Tax=Clostridium hydrogeniformans TaxID=349933 RepID=UPI000485F5A4|nr:motility protein A [Clostridium hydrogeniformans]
MKKLDLMTVIGLIFGVTVILYGILVGGSIMSFWDFGSVLITICGSFAALMINYPIGEFKNIFKVMAQSFTETTFSKNEIINNFIVLSRKARREGLLSLEDETNSIEDPYFKKGLQMVIDGVEPENIKEILELEITEMEARHSTGYSMVRSWGGYAPAFGMIGTLIGLIQMLVNLDDSSKIASGMAVALITTFYGAFLANMLFNPMASKLQVKSNKEIAVKEMILEGVLSIQSGVNPRIIEEKLLCYLSPKEKVSYYASSPKEEGVAVNG